MANICIIPARGGSKRIPRKNIKQFLGKPIIAYSIEAAIKSNLFDEIMVSTDDEEIAEIAIKHGAKIPFFRSSKTADDFATTSEVLAEVLGEYLKKGRKFDFACCIYPTAALISSDKVKTVFDLLCRENFDAAFPIVSFSYPILRSLKLLKGKVALNWPEFKDSRSQDLPVSYHDSGQFYWFVIEQFLKTKEIITDNCGGLKISEIEVQDIDNETDWEIAEMKFKLMKSI